ncbi:phosphatidylinositol 3-kinase 59F isoform X2 [Oratosquilla oratoria]|uniref:phosphatidylinositol 3-kinase 59F isoform X2 n=1 Tax=Oratosquilla oratoria TaxID=337810 RepID=UPI003F76C98F
MEPNYDKFWYVHSCDLDVNIQVKIGTLDGKREKLNYEALLKDPLLKYSGLHQKDCSDLYVTCQVYADGRPHTLPVRTSYKPFDKRWSWNEWLTLPIRFCDLPGNAVLALTIYDCFGPRRTEPIGGTTVSFFGKHGVFRQGMHDLRVWTNRAADGVNNPSSTPGKGHDDGKDQMQRLGKLAKKHRNGHMVKVDWLDRLTFREIEMINEREKRTSNFMYLMVEFPRVEYEGVIYSIVYWERDGHIIHECCTHGQVVRLPDTEIALENLQESKHHRLARSLRSGVTDRDLKPNAAVRDALHTIIEYPPTKQLTSDEQDQVWKYRFYLSTQKKALTKFLKCVNWKLPGETKQALDLLSRWTPPDVGDALELLGPGSIHPAVRRYAVTRLKQAPDEDLVLYLLQLVQALRYESWDEDNMSLLAVSHYSSESDLSTDPSDTHNTSLSDQPDTNANIPTPLTGSMTSSGQDLTRSNSSSQDQSEAPTLKRSPMSSVIGSGIEEGLEESTSQDQNENITSPELLGELKLPSDPSEECDLASFLIQRACENSSLANYFYWYLWVECEDQDPNFKHDTKVKEMYIWVMGRFMGALQRGNKEAKMARAVLIRQRDFLDKLVILVKSVARDSGNRMKKTEKLRSLLAESENNFTNFEPLPLPLDPEVVVRGIISSRATLFKSALEPCRLTFNTLINTEYVAIFKHGDDLRQDQLILQIITLMDRLLRRENLDLKLTPYRALATSSRHGFVQFVESSAVAEVLRTDGTIQNFFRQHAPSETGPYGISSEVMDNYIKSCAGYCVITYLLGIGDRHLDNLLLTRQGNLFHIDFGYILGRDPKPLPPPMKLSKEMVEGMGGAQSEHYHDFRKLCYTAFQQLRRHANLILNLFSLMVDANVPDIALEPDKTVKKVEDKFRLDLSDEEAVSYMQGLIDDSVNAVVAAMVEQLHKIAQYIRK